MVNKFYRLMHHLFWRTLCPRPDGWLNITLRGWPYNITGRIASFFHVRICDICIARRHHHG